jgi:hypothetical protein
MRYSMRSRCAPAASGCAKAKVAVSAAASSATSAVTETNVVLTALSVSRAVGPPCDHFDAGKREALGIRSQLD